MALPLSRPSLRRQDFDQVLDAMIHDRLASGEISRQLCRDMSRYFSIKDGVVLSSINDAVGFILTSLGLRNGDVIILSPLAPAYWFYGLQRAGITPVFADVMPDSPTIDPDSIGELVVQAPRAIIADSCLGFIPDFSALRAFGLPVIEDCTHGLGGRLNGGLVGTFGDAVFARFSPETLVAGSGGCFAGIRQSSGSLKEDWPVWENLSDLGSALVLSQWSDAEIFAEKKQEHYRQLFHRLPKGYRLPRQIGDGIPVSPWFPVLVDSGVKDVLAHSRKKAVEADWAFRKQTFFNADTAQDFCPRARYFLFHTVIFPLYSTFSQKELELLGKVISSLP